jgi:hypothetical protein
LKDLSTEEVLQRMVWGLLEGWEHPMAPLLVLTTVEDRQKLLQGAVHLMVEIRIVGRRPSPDAYVLLLNCFLEYWNHGRATDLLLFLRRSMSMDENYPSNEVIWKSAARGVLCCLRDFSAKISGFERLKNVVENSEFPINSSERESLKKHIYLEDEFALEEPFLANVLKDSMDILVNFISADDFKRRFDIVRIPSRLSVEMSDASLLYQWAECIRETIALDSILIRR